MEDTVGDVVWASINTQMGYISNSQRMPVSEYVFGIALKVKVLGTEPTKDDFLKELWGEDVIFVKMISPPCQESIGVNRLIIKWTKTSHQ